MSVRARERFGLFAFDARLGLIHASIILRSTHFYPQLRTLDVRPRGENISHRKRVSRTLFTSCLCLSHIPHKSTSSVPTRCQRSASTSPAPVCVRTIPSPLPSSSFASPLVQARLVASLSQRHASLRASTIPYRTSLSSHRILSFPHLLPRRTGWLRPRGILRKRRAWSRAPRRAAFVLDTVSRVFPETNAPLFVPPSCGTLSQTERGPTEKPYPRRHRYLDPRHRCLARRCRWEGRSVGKGGGKLERE